MKIAIGPSKTKRLSLEKMVSVYQNKMGIYKGLHGEKYDFHKIDETLEFFIPCMFYNEPDEYYLYVEDETEFIQHCNFWNDNFTELAYNEFHLKLTDDQIEDIIANIYNNFYNIKTQTHIGLTVRPKPDVTFDDFYKKTCKAMSKKWIVEYTLVFEQSGKNIEEIGIGFHFHALIKLPQNKKPSRAREEFFSTFGSQVGPKGIFLSKHKIYDQKGIDKMYKYIGYDDETKSHVCEQGIDAPIDYKDDDIKGEAVRYDKEWRELKGLRHVYIDYIQ